MTETAQETQARFDLQAQFVNYAAQETTALRPQRPIGPEFEHALNTLIYDHGAHPHTRATIINALDDMAVLDPKRALFAVCVAVGNANVKHGWGETAEEKADREGRAALEDGLALLWKHTVVNTQGLTADEKMREVKDHLRCMSSEMLENRAKEALALLTARP